MEQGNGLLTHDELRQWGYGCYYDFSHGGEETLDALSRLNTFRKGLDVLAFPSDYFPLRILSKLETIKSKWMADDGGEESETGNSSPLFVLTARKMACLYQTLYEVGFRLSGDSNKGEHGKTDEQILGNVISDRFAFLEPNLKEIKSKLDEFESKLEEFKSKLEEFRSKLGEFESKLARPEANLDKFKLSLGEFESSFDKFKSNFGEFESEFAELELSVVEVESRLVELKKGPIYLIDDLSRRGEQLKRRTSNFSEHLKKEPETEVLIDLKNNRVDAEHFRLISGDDGVGMIRAYARTFAKALVPYFTDFPVTEKIRLDADQFEQFTKTLENFNVYEVSTSVGIDEGLRSYTLDLTEVLKGDELVEQLKQICHVIKFRIFVAAPSDPTQSDAKYRIRVIIKPVFRRISAKVLHDIGSDNGFLEENKKCTLHQLGQVFGVLQYLASWALLRPALEKLGLYEIALCGLGQVSEKKTIQPSEESCESGCVDVAFSQMVLGENLYKLLRKYIERDESGKLKRAEKIEKIVKAVEDSLKTVKRGSFKDDVEPSGNYVEESGERDSCPPAYLYTLGDDIIQPLDKIVSDHTRAGRNKLNVRSSEETETDAEKDDPGAEKEWRRQSFDDLVEKMKGDATLSANEGRQDGKLSRDEVSFIVGLGLDTLTDWGKIVPDQQAVRKKSKGQTGDGAEPLPRLKEIDAKNLESIYIERCFRAGEITALVTAKTLTGGALSISATSRKKVQREKREEKRKSEAWITWAGGKITWAGGNKEEEKKRKTEVSDSGNNRNWCKTICEWLRPKVFPEDAPLADESRDGESSSPNDFPLPKDVCLSLLDVLREIPERINLGVSKKREKGGEKEGGWEKSSLVEIIERTRGQYRNLPCPAIAMTDNPEGVEYALDIFNHFYKPFGKNDKRSNDERDRVKKLLEQESALWEKQHDCLGEMGVPWSFRSFRRLRRAVLAVDSLLAFLHPILTAENKASDADGGNLKNAYRILDRDADSYNDGGEDSVGSLTTNDVWEDWVHKLDGPPAPLRYSKSDILDSNEMNQAIVVALPDLLGDAWHALTHAFQALCLETETNKPYLSHRVSIQGVVEKIWTAVRKHLSDQMLTELPFGQEQGKPEDCDTCGQESRGQAKQVNGDGGTETQKKRSRDSSAVNIKYSPFAEGDVLLTASQIIGREWIFRSGSQWFPFGFSDLKHLVDSGKVIEVVDWQGGKRYPSYQFVRFCLREGIWVSADGKPVKATELNGEAQVAGSNKSGRAILCTDPDYPFLRRDISETMSGSSMAVSGWSAALWFGDMISKTLLPPDEDAKESQNTPSYLGLLFRESLSQKGLWIDNWLSDGRHILGGNGDGFVRESRKTLEAAGWSKGSKALYRITSASYEYPDWWASSIPFEEKLELLAGYRNRTIPERKLRGEPEFSAGRFDPGEVSSGPCKLYEASGGPVDAFGALYLADSVEGCVLEVFDRNIAVTLDDVLSQSIYVYQTYWDIRAQQCFDLSGWPALVSATPIRSATQALAGWICENLSPCEVKLIQYPLRTSMELRGFVVLEPTYLETKPGNETRSMVLHEEGRNNLETTANHKPTSKVHHGETDGAALWFEKKSQSWDYWRGLESLRRQPHDSVVCFRRFPCPDSADLDGDV